MIKVFTTTRYKWKLQDFDDSAQRENIESDEHVKHLRLSFTIFFGISSA